MEKENPAVVANRPKWTPHGHVAEGKGHRVITFLGNEEKVTVGIRRFGGEVFFTIPWQGTIYQNVDVRRRVLGTMR